VARGEARGEDGGVIARPALAAVTEALDGVTDPREAVEILVARDLWPMEWPGVDHFAPDVTEVVAVASLGVPRLLAVAGLAQHAGHTRGDVVRVQWLTQDGDHVRGWDAAAPDAAALDRIADEGVHPVVAIDMSDDAVDVYLVVPPLP